MAEVTFVCLYLSYLNTLSPLSDAALGKVVRAMIKYVKYGEEPKLTGKAETLWPSIQFQLDRDMENYKKKCKQNQANGRKGGRPRKNQTVLKKAKEKEKENENENEKENENERENEIENKIPENGEVFSPRALFSPPSVEEVKEYVQNQGLHLDVWQFMDHYTSNGWMVGRNPMHDWQAAVRNWTRKESQYGKTESEQMEYNFGQNL